ncbi:hypothetical protein [Laceyella putida]|uniref:Uncharacterized protein n=2 Tax=Laceyella putida TaxID=110101 RepID=A0ABW2RR51_9BACL
MSLALITTILKWLLIASFATFFFYLRNKKKDSAKQEVKQATPTTSSVKYEE